MKTLTSIVSAAAASMFLGAVVSAAPIVTVSVATTTPTDPGMSPFIGSQTLPGYTGMLLSFTSDVGFGLVTTIDASADGRGIFGSLAQTWVSGASTPTGTSTTSADSHFLAPNVFTSFDVAETKTSEGAMTDTFPSFVDNGLGTSLKGTFAINPGLTSGPLAYVVIKNDQTASYSVQFVNGQGIGSIVSGTIAVPEPTSLSVFGLAGLAALRRRRA